MTMQTIARALALGLALTLPTSATAQAELPAAGTVFKDCAQCPEMVVVPAGQFVMGSPPMELDRDDDEGPPHKVVISKPFAAGKYEVTFDEWDACVQDSVCAQVSDEGWGHGRRPVINVSYTQAVEYIKWLSDKAGKRYRLLSEAEWEYAARAGSEKPRFWGAAADQACEFANVYDLAGKAAHNFSGKNFACDDGYAETAPVGTFKPNGFGLYDTLGNVWEWVEDCWNPSYKGAPWEGRAWATGDCSRRVFRGGSWSGEPRYLRSAGRNRGVQSAHGNFLGFRVARTLP